jgi:hypothetical protein
MLPFNCTVGTPNGANLIINTMQLQVKKLISTPMSNNLPPTWVTVFFDLTNMYNSVSCHLFCQLITKSFPEILPVMTLFYNQASTVHHKWADGTWRTLLMKDKGMSQGCPLSPIFASLVGTELLEPVDHLLRQQATERLCSGNDGTDGNRGVTHLLGYVDDVLCTPLDDLQFLCKHFDQLGSPLGCFLNLVKTRILTSTSSTSPLAAICLANPTLATSIEHTISTYSTNPTTQHPPGSHFPSNSQQDAASLGPQLDQQALPSNTSTNNSIKSSNASS